MTIYLSKFLEMSRSISEYPGMVQGGGGNTSVKINADIMLIKASGVRLSEMSGKNGYVGVEWKKIHRFFKNSKTASFANAEIGSRSVIDEAVIPEYSCADSRPSIEAGFHVLLDRFVLHTHSVYVNSIACVREGENLMKTVLVNRGIPAVWIPYSNPGASLTKQFAMCIKKYRQRHAQTVPQVFILQNHGLVVTGATAAQTLRWHVRVHSLLKKFLSVQPCPRVTLEDRGENLWQSKTSFLLNFIHTHPAALENFSALILFPDQVVFGKDIVIRPKATKRERYKTVIATADPNIIYYTNFREAQNIEEILTAWAYIIKTAEKNRLTLSTISTDDIAYISNMEMEKYRRQLVE